MTSKDGAQPGMDLVDQAVCQIAFLKAVSGNKELCKDEVQKQALYRYENLWLPLVAEHPGEYLCAPMDIEWIWYCHMLSPKDYEKDCNSIVKMTVNHTIHKPDDFQRLRNQAYEYWTEKYVEPFYLDYSAISDDEIPSDYSSNISYDILKSIERQCSFLYHVSLPHYLDRKFLEGASARYKKFLQLKKQHRNETLVPSSDIELIWRTHRLNPVVYKSDTIKVVGYLLNPDNSAIEVDENAELEAATKRTEELWKLSQNEPFARYGAMHRGFPPFDTMYTITPDDEFSFCTKKCVISFDQINLHMPSPDLNRSKNIALKVVSAKVSKTEVSKWFTLKRPANSKPGSPVISWTKVGSFNFDTSNEHGILFSIQQKSKMMGPKTELDSNFLDIMALIESPQNATKPGGLLKGRIPLKENTTLDVLAHFQKPTTGDAFLFLEGGQYKDDVIPEEVQEMLGPIGFEKLPKTANNRCKVAMHTLNNHRRQTAFKVRTIHSISLMTSVIQVFYKDNICAIAHLIGNDQLPLPTMVTDDVMTINQRKGERAVLIKNDSGDWAVVSGYWTGPRRGQVPVSGGPGAAMQGVGPGTLAINFFKISTGEVHQTELGYEQRQYGVNLESCRADLKNGCIRINPDSNEVAENISLVFAVSLLHVLCVPRQNRMEGIGRVLGSTNGDARSFESVPSDAMVFVRAAGLRTKTPSNGVVAQRFGKRFCVFCNQANDNDSHDKHPDIEREWDQLPGLDFRDFDYGDEDSFEDDDDDNDVSSGSGNYTGGRVNVNVRNTNGRGSVNSKESSEPRVRRASEDSRNSIEKAVRRESLHKKDTNGFEEESSGSERVIEASVHRDNGSDVGKDVNGLADGSTFEYFEEVEEFEITNCEAFQEEPDYYDTRL